MHLHPEIYFCIREQVKSKALEKRETCHHWINFEIYDYLSKDLKQKYLDQFDLPNFIYDFNERKMSGMCRANHLDSPSECRCDCSDKYPATLKFIKEEIMNDKPEVKGEENGKEMDSKCN